MDIKSYVRGIIDCMPQMDWKVLHKCVNFEGDICESLYDSIADDMGLEASEYACGMSKFVWWDERFPDIVFKIPFDHNLDLSDEEYTFSDFCEMTEDELYDIALEEDGVALVGAGDDCDGYDYCAREVKVYDAAMNWGLESIFCRTSFLLEHMGLRVYVSVRADRCYDEYADVGTKDSRTKAGKYEYSALGPDRNALVIDEYGETFLQRLTDFIEVFKVYDLHDGNTMMKDGRIVIIDYSGYDC